MTDFEADIIIRDGSLLHVRSLKLRDEPLVLEFVRRLSEESISFRFFGSGISKQSAVDALMNRGFEGFVIIALREERILAHAGYYVTSPGTAEIGVIVSDDYRQKGLGTLLVGELAEIASHNGIGTFEAIVVPENYTMIDMLRSLGFPIVQKIEPGSIRIMYPTSLLPDALEKFEHRESVATIAAVNHILCPKSVAVIWDSPNRDPLGKQLLANLVEGNFNGRIYSVNSNEEKANSSTTFASVVDCPEKPELAFVSVSADEVEEVAKQCAKKGVSSLVVLSSGFAESGSRGVDRQNRLVEICRKSGMRLVGPNCIGVVNTDHSVRLNGQPYSAKPSHGRMGFFSQSGALGISVIDCSSKLGLGISSFVSVGNKADISGNDLIQYWEGDENTDLILLYLESFGNPKKFGTITKRVTKKKPIFVVKSGRSLAGFRATQSHTGTLLATSDDTVDALFKQAGVIRTETLEEMFDAAALLSTEPIPRGNRVGIITNTGGAGILAVDTCESLGMEVQGLTEETRTAIEASLPLSASGKNPVDLSRLAVASDFGKAIKIIAKDPNIDSLIIIFVPSTTASSEKVANEILKADLDLGHSITLVASFMACHGVTDLLSGNLTYIPSYPFPESAVRALSHAVRYGYWVRKPVGHTPDLSDVRRSEAAAVIAKALKGGARWLTLEEATLLLDCYHIPIAKGALEKGTQNDYVQMTVGIVHDPIFGSIVACGASGAYVEFQKDISVRLAPLNEEDADEMLTSLKTYPILAGYKGAQPADVEALRDIILRIGRLADDLQEIAELDLNPINIHRNHQGAYVLDAKVRIAPFTHYTPIGAKR